MQPSGSRRGHGGISRVIHWGWYASTTTGDFELISIISRVVEVTAVHTPTNKRTRCCGVHGNSAMTVVSDYYSNIASECT